MKAMHALYLVGLEDISLRMWHSLKDLISWLVVNLSPLQHAGNLKYDSQLIMGELLQAMAEVIHKITGQLIRQASFVEVVVDETADVSNIIQLDTHDLGPSKQLNTKTVDDNTSNQ